MNTFLYRCRVFLVSAVMVSGLLVCSATRPAVTSSFNDLSLDVDANWNEYSFVVFGHIRGGYGRASPNSVLQAQVQRMWMDEPAFAMSLGDLYYNIENDTMPLIEQWVRDNVPVPFFNAVGNHDTMTGGILLADGTKIPSAHNSASYIQRFGPLYFDFTLGSELFVVMDTARGYRLTRDQVTFLEETISRARQDTTIKNVFIFTHKIFWSYYNPEMAPVFRYRHPVRPPVDYNLFRDRIKPLLLPLSADKSVFLISGDTGGGANYLQTFYQKDDHFVYLATGMGNTDRDSFVTVTISNSVVTMKNTNLSTGQESSLANYGVEYWKSFYRDNPDSAAKVDRIGRPD